MILWKLNFESNFLILSFWSGVMKYLLCYKISNQNQMKLYSYLMKIIVPRCSKRIKKISVCYKKKNKKAIKKVYNNSDISVLIYLIWHFLLYITPSLKWTINRLLSLYKCNLLKLQACQNRNIFFSICCSFFLLSVLLNVFIKIHILCTHNSVRIILTHTRYCI